MSSSSNNSCSKSKCDQFLESYRPRQNWSLPSTVIYYIAKNPKTKELYQKLIQSCKYFFVKNPILILESLFFNHKNNKWTVNVKQLQKQFDLNNVLCKFWITEELKVLSDEPTSFSSITPFIDHCDAKKLRLQNQNISLDEFSLISSKVENMTLSDTVVKNYYGSTVPFEKLVEELPKIKDLQFSDNHASSSITTFTAKKLSEMPHFSQIDYFGLSNIPETFNIETLFTYIKKNQSTKFFLHFSDSISQAYKNRLEAINDEILETETHEYKIPHIDFEGLDYVTRNRLLSFQLCLPAVLQ
uniref:Uncharacterized protein n=1 Tax=Panagrolaimus sp. ES5 TaxID=591445 RepID=A0AC34FB55_9BILA